MKFREYVIFYPRQNSRIGRLIWISQTNLKTGKKLLVCIFKKNTYDFVPCTRTFALTLHIPKIFFMRHNSQIDLTTFLAYVTFFSNTEKHRPKLLASVHFLMLLERICFAQRHCCLFQKRADILQGRRTWGLYDNRPPPPTHTVHWIGLNDDIYRKIFIWSLKVSLSDFGWLLFTEVWK